MRGSAQVRQNAPAQGRGRAVVNNAANNNRGAAQRVGGGQVRMPAPAMGRGVQNMGRGAPLGRGAPFGNSFASAFGAMQDLIQEYSDLDIGSLEDLSKTSMVEVAKKITKAIKARDYDKFSQIIGIIEQELKNKQPQEEYYYEEDADSEEEEKEEPIIRNPQAYVKKLSKFVDVHTNDSMLHLAVQQAAEFKDTRFLQRLLGINFPLYQEDANGHFPIFMLSLMQDDKVFIECYRLFKKRNININRCSKKTNQNFLEFLCQFRINKVRIQEIFQDSKLYISQEDSEKYFSLIQNQNQLLSQQEKVLCVEEIRKIYFLEKRKTFLFLVHKLQQRHSQNGLAKIKDGVLREIAKYL